MPYYAVHSGNVFRCVLADDPMAACVIAVTQHCNDEDASPCEPGVLFATAEPGQSSADNVFILSDRVAAAGNFRIEQRTR